MANLRLDDIVNVVVSTQNAVLPREGFNIGLILGFSARIPVHTRCVRFENLTEMLDYGFLVTDPEYKAALLYFTQAKTPNAVIIGRGVNQAITAACTATHAGTGITNATVTQATFAAKVGAANDGVYTFTYSGGWLLDGASVTISDYGITVTGTPVAGDTVTITYTPAYAQETGGDMLDACRNANGSWYGVYCCGASLTNAQHIAFAQWCDENRACYFYENSDATAITVATTDIFSQLKSLGIQRACGLYNATAYAGAAVMGFAMGANDGTAGSAYTLAYKQLAGVATTDLTSDQITKLAGKNANYYITRGASFKLLEKGVCADGTWFDELIGTDQLANDLQEACMNVLATGTTKVPYTDAGALQFVLACNEVCADAVTTGFLTPGIWQGATILDLETGDTLTAGYMCQAERVADQSAASRQNRVCPPIYVCAILAGAIHSVTVKVDVE